MPSRFSTNAYRDLNVNRAAPEARGVVAGTQNPVQFTITASTPSRRYSSSHRRTTPSRPRPAHPKAVGSVTLNPPGGTYAAGTRYRDAPAQPRLYLLRWSGDESGNANPLTITGTKNMNITALLPSRGRSP